MNNHQILILSGSSGSGKSTLVRMLVDKYPQFSRVITVTSRKPRVGEKNGVDYYFFTRNDFMRRIKRGEFLEYTFIKKREQYYGTLKSEVMEKLDEGKVPVANVEYVGAKFYKENFAALSIFISPDSIENLKKRLIARDPSIARNDLKNQIENAKREIAQERPHYDVEIINRENKINETFADLEQILKANRYL